MTPSYGGRHNSDGLTVAILTDHWESATEHGWLTRQLAGALACTADVHVVTPNGSSPGTVSDSIFTVHGLDPDLGVEAAVATVSHLDADGLVFVEFQWADLIDAFDQFDRNAPINLFMVAPEWDNRSRRPLAQLLERSRSVMVVTQTDQGVMAALGARPEELHRIGAPLAAHPSALSEPDPMVGCSEYVLVRAPVEEQATDPIADLSQLLRIRFPDTTIAVLYRDSFSVWCRGRVKRADPVCRSSDLARLMAWAQVTVDLRPDRLFARTCVESLLYGTPIVVPHDSRAREHAERGRGGLWFTDPAELIWSVEAILEPTVRAAFSVQGQKYAEQEYGSTDRFIERVITGCGLTPSASPHARTTPAR